MELFDSRVLGSSSMVELEELGLDVLVGLVPHYQTFCVGNPIAYDSLTHTLNIISWLLDNRSYNARVCGNNCM